MKYKSGQNESIFDVALATGGMDGLADLLKENPGLINPLGLLEQGRVTHNIAAEDLAVSATTVPDAVFSEDIPVSITPLNLEDTISLNGRTRIEKSGQNESVFDFASRNYGLALFGLLLKDNPGLIEPGGTFNQYRVEHKIKEVSASSEEIERINQERTQVQKTEGAPLYLSGSRQTVFDVCLTQYGGIEALPYLLADNQNTVKPDGYFRQFREQYNIRKLAFVHLGVKAKMLALRPESGIPAQGGPWITDDGQDWWTNDNQAWVTQQ